MSHFQIADELEPAGVDGGGDVAVVVASGEIDYGSCPLLRRCILGHIEAGRRRLVVDLTWVSFIDSMAIGVLVGAVTRLQEAGSGSLLVVCAGENTRVLRIFDIAGVADVIGLYRSREDALRALAAAWIAEVPMWARQGVSDADDGRLLPAVRQPVAPGALRRYAEEAANNKRGVGSDAAVRAGTRRGVDELA